MISTVAEVKSPDGQKWLLGADGKIYQERKGPLHAVVQASSLFQRAWDAEDQQEAILYYEEKLLPPKEHIKALHKELFRPYNHEVLCWWGIPRKKKLKLADRTIEAPPVVFFVPTQEASWSSVEACEDTRDRERQIFRKYVRIMGDIHSHPGKGMPSRSGTDENDMEGTVGFFGIIAQGAPMIRWYGAVDEVLSELCEWKLGNKKAARDLLVLTDNGKPLNQVIQKPKTRGYLGGRNQGGTVTIHDRRKVSAVVETSTKSPEFSSDTTFVSRSQGGWVTGDENCYVWLLMKDMPEGDRVEKLWLVRPCLEGMKKRLAESLGFVHVNLGTLGELTKDAWVGASLGRMYDPDPAPPVTHSEIWP